MHMISGSVSLPFRGFFSPFPHGTSSLSVDHMYLALENGLPIFKQGFTCLVLLIAACSTVLAFTYRPITSYGHSFKNVRLAKAYSPTARLIPVRSPLLRESQLISFVCGYLDGSVLHVNILSLCVQVRISYVSLGLPIRNPPGQSFLASSPKISVG